MNTTKIEYVFCLSEQLKQQFFELLSLIKYQRTYQIIFLNFYFYSYVQDNIFFDNSDTSLEIIV
jgi:hypothetical protein